MGDIIRSLPLPIIILVVGGVVVWMVVSTIRRRSK